MFRWYTLRNALCWFRHIPPSTPMVRNTAHDFYMGHSCPIRENDSRKRTLKTTNIEKTVRLSFSNTHAMQPNIHPRISRCITSHSEHQGNHTDRVLRRAACSRNLCVSSRVGYIWKLKETNTTNYTTTRGGRKRKV